MGYRTATLLLDPTAGQLTGLASLFDAQRWLYNAGLEERRGAWAWERRRVTRMEQYRALTGWGCVEVLRFGVTPARGTLLRLDRAFAGFFRRVKTGAKPGFPRFKSKNRWDSVEYPQAASWKIDLKAGCKNGRLHLQGVGWVRFRTSRRGVPGKPKTLVVRREGRRYLAYVVHEHHPGCPLPRTGKAVGVDLGVTVLAATSDGDLIDNPRHLRDSLDRLAAAQRLAAGRKRGSARRRKAAGRVGCLQRKVARQRRNHAHHVTKALVAGYDTIVVEDLRIANMVKRPKPAPNQEGGFDPNGAKAKAGLDREIHAAGWGQLLRQLSYKAADAGRELVVVNPRHSSQTCPACGHVDPGNRNGTVFRCQRCGHEGHADITAAQNHLRAGLAHRHEREAP